MQSTTQRHETPRSRGVSRTTLALAAAVAMIGLAQATPAKAWYDDYGQWHPNRAHYAREDRDDAWRRHHWCEHHPSQCGTRYSYDRDYRYGNPRYSYYYEPYGYYQYERR